MPLSRYRQTERQDWGQDRFYTLAIYAGWSNIIMYLHFVFAVEVEKNPEEQDGFFVSPTG